jgi:IclR family transcriptional regulator, KDG regulon repressor
LESTVTDDLDRHLALQLTEISQRSTGTTATVDRAMMLLGALGASSRPQNLTQLADHTSLSKSTAFRLLNTLRNAGMVRRDGTAYSLGDRLVELAGRAPEPALAYARDQLREASMPFLQALFAKTNGTVHLAVLDHHRVLYLEKLFGHRRVQTPSRVGGRFPANASAIGKALLAWTDEATVDEAMRLAEAPTQRAITSAEAMYQELARTRRRGFATDEEEAAPGLACVAVPIRNDLGIEAALSVSSAARESWLREHARMAVQAASSIERALAVEPQPRAV